MRWGIIGPGKIAGKFAGDLQLVEDGELYAVASRNKERAAAFAKEFGASRVFGDYQALYRCEDVDVVYIATPHSFHAGEAIAAMEAGKHVLCEKPLGMNSAEVARMISAANSNSRFLMEAMWTRFNPAVSEVLEHIKNGRIGSIRYLQADFGFYAMDQPVDSRLFNPALGGGTLLDIGIYPVFLAYTLLGMPKAIEASSLFLENGVEYQTAVRFDYNHAHALLFSSFACSTSMRAEICGEKGRYFLEPRWHEAGAYTYEQAKGGEVLENRPLKGKGYYYEIVEVQRCIRENLLESPHWSLTHSLDLIGLIDAVSEKIRRR